MASNRYIRGFILAALWLMAFSAPVLLSVVIGAIIIGISGSASAVVVIFIAGGIAGILLAEYIRRRYGLVEYFNKTYGPHVRNDRSENDQ